TPWRLAVCFSCVSKKRARSGPLDCRTPSSESSHSLVSAASVSPFASMTGSGDIVMFLLCERSVAQDVSNHIVRIDARSLNCDWALQRLREPGCNRLTFEIDGKGRIVGDRKHRCKAIAGRAPGVPAGVESYAEGCCYGSGVVRG